MLILPTHYVNNDYLRDYYLLAPLIYFTFKYLY